MPDHAVSSHPRVQAQLDRLSLLSPGADTLGLDRIERLLSRLGNPHERLPPVFHVAGTNGKGSTCAFLRAALEADGRRVHVYTSPHLVRFNERIRLAGRLVDDEVLADTLGDVLDHAGDVGASFFEVTTAVAFRLFADIPADACVIEVGLGGRLDATNILTRAAACGIAQLGLDHQQFLGPTLALIAEEKAGIAKRGVPIATQRYAPAIAAIVRNAAEARAGRPIMQGAGWDIAAYGEHVHYRDSWGHIEFGQPALAGAHQHRNLGLAAAMLRHQDAVPVTEAAIRAAPSWVQWPARLQRLERGPLLAPVPEDVAVWLDGGHNPAAATAIADHVKRICPDGGKIALIVGMLANKDARGFLKPLLPHVHSLLSVPVARHDHHGGEAFAAIAARNGVAHRHHATIGDAVASLSDTSDIAAILIAGSLYLAGEVLEANGQLPD